MSDREVAVVAGQPPDGDEVARHVKTALRAEHDVVQCRVFDPSAAHPAALPITFDHRITHVRRDEAEPFELDLRAAFTLHPDNARSRFNDR